LREVGATNRTHLRDYEGAVTSETAAFLRVHTSNYRIQGFTSEVPLKELRVLGDRYGLPVLEDLGSGSLCDFAGTGLSGEPTVQAVVADGAAVVTFSGDKVLGGPQAGIIVGRREAIETIKRNPLNRAVRIDKMTLAALEATLRLYLDPELARREVPTLRMIAAPEATLKTQAGRLARLLRQELGGRLDIRTRKGVSRVGGGAFPEQDLPTVLVALVPASGVAVEALREALLGTDPPLVGRVEGEALCLDPRTLDTEEFGLAARALAQALDRLQA
jgi:L-seryl-tRNA(Ser) seleniumtransferase